MRKTALLILFFFLLALQGKSQDVFITKNGSVSFVSDAPLEVIKADSEQLEGALDISKRTFAFSIDNRSFKGFNSDLQQEHFYENYMEVRKYPESTFSGKIIEEINPDTEDEQQVRAKGILEIHGVGQERIIKGTLRFIGDKILLSTSFTVPLEDHDIKIPRIVYQKIAESINVSVHAEFTRINE